jgi:hypothetical protein
LIKIIIKSAVLFVFLSTVISAQDISNQDAPKDTIFVMKKSPWGAVLRSAVIPGFGQFYNESYYKIPIIWGLGAWFVYGWIKNNDDYVTNKNLFIDTGLETYKFYRDSFRDQRDNFTIYFVLLYLLNLVDAYVDAHLFDFNVDEDFLRGSTRLNLRLNF